MYGSRLSFCFSSELIINFSLSSDRTKKQLTRNTNIHVMVAKGMISFTLFYTRAIPCKCKPYHEEIEFLPKVFTILTEAMSQFGDLNTLVWSLLRFLNYCFIAWFSSRCHFEDYQIHSSRMKTCCSIKRNPFFICCVL